MNNYDLPYYMTIMAIQDTLQNYYEPKSNFGYNYLKNRCMETSKLTSLILPKLIQQAGFINGQWHAWNLDTQNNLIIDLSLWQFQDLKISPNNYLFPKDSTLHKFNKKALWEQKTNFKLNAGNIEEKIEQLLKNYDEIKDGYI